MKHIFSFLIFIFIVGCATVASAQQTNIVFIGNSITQGVILDDPGEEAPPVRAVRWLEQQIPGKIEFRNCGISGSTTVNFLPASNTFFTRVKAAADEFSKGGGTLLFSIMLGTNDSALRGNLKSRMQPEQYYTNMKAITDELLRLYPSCRIVLNRPIWYSPTTHNTSTYLQEGLDVLQSYFPELKKLAADYCFTFPGQVMLGDTAAFDHFKDNKPLFFKEEGNSGTFYLHPNKTGAQKLGEFWGKAIKRAVQPEEWTEYPLGTVKDTPAMDRGIALIVLKYRMPQGNPSVPVTDVQAAFDLVKQNASEWRINPEDIGIMGSSAGGHLASTYATHTTGAERPAFQILLYPVITMDKTFTHAGSRKNLIGEDPSTEQRSGDIFVVSVRRSRFRIQGILFVPFSFSFRTIEVAGGVT